MGMTFDDRKVRKMFKEIKTKVGGTGDVVIGPFGYHGNMKGTTLTGELGSYHFNGRGRNPVRNPLGFGRDGLAYWHKMIHEVLRGKRTVKSALTNTGNFMEGRIKLRMTRGIDHKGRPFKAYSDGYRKYKTEFGGSKKGQKNRSAKPNLQFTGILRESINYEVHSK